MEELKHLAGLLIPFDEIAPSANKTINAMDFGLLDMRAIPDSVSRPIYGTHCY